MFIFLVSVSGVDEDGIEAESKDSHIDVCRAKAAVINSKDGGWDSEECYIADGEYSSSLLGDQRYGFAAHQYLITIGSAYNHTGAFFTLEYYDFRNRNKKIGNIDVDADSHRGRFSFYW